MRAPRARLRVEPETYFGGRRGVEAIVEARISRVMSRPRMLWSREGRANQPKADREAASRRRKEQYP